MVMTSLEAAKFSLEKWEYLAKFVGRGTVLTPERDNFLLLMSTAETCALCAIHLTSSRRTCRECPLYVIGLGCNFFTSPWSDVVGKPSSGSMKKMVKALRLAVAYAEKHSDMKVPLEVGRPG
jgi:hypothetical protein